MIVSFHGAVFTKYAISLDELEFPLLSSNVDLIIYWPCPLVKGVMPAINPFYFFTPRTRF